MLNPKQSIAMVFNVYFFVAFHFQGIIQVTQNKDGISNGLMNLNFAVLYF